MRRGLTLIELLLALTLLTGVAAATLPLTRSVLGGAREIDQKLLWQRSAEMTLGEIDRLLLRRDRRDRGTPGIRVENECLVIPLTGGSIATLALDSSELKISMSRPPDRVLIGNLDGITFAIDEESETLMVELRSSHSGSVQRSWDLVP